MKKSAYTKLPGKGKSLRASFFTAERQRLYESSDHLMVSIITYVEEKHKKFYYEDIQAITVMNNNEGRVLSFLWGIITAIILFSGAYIETQMNEGGEVLIVFVAMSLVSGIMLIITLMRGPTCSVHLHTAVQVEELTCLRQYRAARKAIALINERIHATQGSWPESRSTSEAWDTQYFPASANSQFLKRDAKPIEVIKGNWNKAGFITILIFGFSCLADMLYMHNYKDNFDSFLLFASQTIIVLALIRQVNSSLPRSVQNYTWATIIFNGLSIMVFIPIFALLTTHGDIDSVNVWADRPLWEQIFVLISSGGNIILGILGLLALSRYKVVRRIAENIPAYDGDDN